jgi:hypothetical protein
MCRPLASATCGNADSCDPADYSGANASFAVLPAAAPGLEATLAARVAAGATPTATAMQGAIAAATEQAVTHPERTVVVVLATDGVPDESDSGGGACAPSDPTAAGGDTASVAATGLAGSPSVETFVIGVFTPDTASSAASSLDAVARAGGTGHAFVLDAIDADGGAGLEARFVQALDDVRSASLPCRYGVPFPEAGDPDLGRLNVTYTSGAGSTSTVPRVEASAACGSGDGWFLDGGGSSAAAAMIDVCPATCAALRKDPGGRVDVVVGCQAVVR